MMTQSERQDRGRWIMCLRTMGYDEIVSASAVFGIMTSLESRLAWNFG